MSRAVLEKELGLIRQRLQAIEEALGEEMTAEDKTAGKSIPFKPKRSRTRRR